MPNRLSQFWQELKRRKVTRVITIYSAAAFVIVELVDIVAPNLGLPSWTFNLVLILLLIGFVITVIISWIYDIHPEGGIVKTEPANKVTAEEIPNSSSGWRVASYISFVVIIGLIVLNIIPRTSKKENLDKSIAVLPFRNDSPDEEKMYFINGTMEAILDNLCRIGDLRVPGRTSVEQYRDVAKPIPVIAQELRVSYILEGSGQKIGDRVLLTVQLLDAINDHHLWSKQYDREIQEVEDLIDIQSEIAQLVAAEIKAVITPNEKERIEDIPTTSLTAYDFYQRGREKYVQYRLDDRNREALKRAEDLFHKALDYDSTFSKAYTGLAELYWYNNYWSDHVSEEFLDSMLNLANIALSFDDQLAEAYVLRGNYFERYGKKEEAINEYDKAIKLNPNLYEVHFFKGYLYYRNSDWVKAIDNYQKAASMHRGPFLPEIYSRLGAVYEMIGFMEKRTFFAKEKLKLDDDSANYYFSLGTKEETIDNIEIAIELYEKSNTFDSTEDIHLYRLGMCHSYLGFYEEYLEYFKKIHEANNQIDPQDIFRLGHAYWVNGFKEKAEPYLNEGLRLQNENLESDRHILADYITYFCLAANHAFLGNKDKAYEYLSLMLQEPSMPSWMTKDLNNDPLFDSIRDEPEFQQIVRDVQVKYQAEHERVREWLEENEML